MTTTATTPDSRSAASGRHPLPSPTEQEGPAVRGALEDAGSIHENTRSARAALAFRGQNRG
ncbi:hypothetical protein [Kineococcus esterisolvens]|uniref:hypothetical protein n=1 Tax=unclassified Kineococcus TaxID=2621656 RepID=UPI003D7DE051